MGTWEMVRRWVDRDNGVLSLLGWSQRGRTEKIHVLEQSVQSKGAHWSLLGIVLGKEIEATLQGTWTQGKNREQLGVPDFAYLSKNIHINLYNLSLTKISKNKTQDGNQSNWPCLEVFRFSKPQSSFVSALPHSISRRYTRLFDFHWKWDSYPTFT